MNLFTVVIPLRLASKRLKGKPLIKINGLPLFIHIYKRISNKISSTYIATYDDQIIEECKKNGIPFIKTSEKPRNGSERLAEAVIKAKIKSPIIVDLQGDEIDADIDLIKGVVKTLVKNNAEVSTAVSYLDKGEVENRDIVKAVMNKNNECIFFTRSTIPYKRYKSRLDPSVYKHIGIYCYKRETLLRYIKLNPTYLEESESLEQMRLIENGIKVFGFLSHKSYRKIDNINELKKIRGQEKW